MRLLGVLTAVLLSPILASCGGGDSSPAPTAGEPLRSAPVYSSVDGALHLRVTADTAASEIAGVPYKHMDIYKTELVGGKGRSSDGSTSTYVGAQWSVKPGDTLTIDYVNKLDDAQFAPIGSKGDEPTPQPLNLHTHGLTVSPSGNSDNVLLSIPKGRSNRFTIKIPRDQYHGLYWYHPHIHGITDEQVYMGLAGHIVVGRADGDYKQFNGLAVHPMMIRYNVVKPGDDGELVDASASDTHGTALTPSGRMIYSVNGQLRPRIKLRAAGDGKQAESQVWAMTNITGSATYVLALDEVDAKDATNPSPDVKSTPLDFTIVSEDGTPMPRPLIVPARAGGRGGYLLGQGGRVAILVQGPSAPGKVVRLLQLENRSGTGKASAHQWKSTDEDPVPKGYPIGGWRDYTRDVLAVGEPDASRTQPHVDTPARLTTNYAAHNDDLEHAKVDRKRTFLFNGVATSTVKEPNNFPVNDELFAFNRVDQPKAGTVEEWTILNTSSLHHPFHVHTQYGKVMEVVAPAPVPDTTPEDEYPTVQSVADLSQPKPAEWTQDVVNLPPARVGPDGMPILRAGGDPVEPGKVVLRLRFEDYLGEYVEHCHRLPHEDRGMMSLVRTIPHDPVYAVTSTSGRSVSVYRSSDDTIVGKPVVPFPDAPPQAAVSTAIGDVDGDTIPDLAVASGAGMQTTVAIYLGRERYASRHGVVHPFGAEKTGASVALGDLNGDDRDDIVAGAGPGSPGRVAIFDGETRDRLADFDAYRDPAFRGGVAVATGMLEEGGRISLVTGAGAGPLKGPRVKVFNVDLFGDDKGAFPDIRHKLVATQVAAFDGTSSPAAGVSVATANPYAGSGGFSDVLVTPLTGPAKVRIFAIHQHMPEGQIDVSASGVARPHAYDPTAKRMAIRIDDVDLELAGPAGVAALSTATGARLVVVPSRGGSVSLWESADKMLPPQGRPITRIRTLPAQGSAVSGM